MAWTLEISWHPDLKPMGYAQGALCNASYLNFVLTARDTYNRGMLPLDHCTDPLKPELR